MSDSTWICITPSPFWDGRFGTWYCRELCRCDRACWEDIWYDRFDWLLARRWIIVRRMVLPTYTIIFLQHRAYRLHIRQPFRLRTSRARHAFFNYFDDALMSSGHVRARVVAPSLNTSPRSPVSVLRSSQPWADLRLLLRSAAEPMAFRPAAAVTSAPPFLLCG